MKSGHLSGERLIVGCLAVCLSLTACSAVGYRVDTGPSERETGPRGSVVVFVSNDYGEDVRVFVVRGTTRIPIGSVGSYSARRFVIPPAQVGSSGVLELVAQSLASRAIAAPEALDLQSGAEVEFHIENVLSYSRLVPRIYRRTR